MKESYYNIWARTQAGYTVYNAVSGLLIRLTDSEYHGLQEFIGGKDDVPCPDGLLRQLVLGRMLINDQSNEADGLQRRYNTGRCDDTSMGLTIVTSLGCNFDCPYCFEAKHPSIMSALVQHQLLQLISDRMPRLRSLAVTWFGGEPLVGKKALLNLSDELIALCDTHNVQYGATIVTNGYHLDESTSRELLSRRVHAAQVTIDGPPEVHDKMRPLIGGGGTFSRIIHNLKKACTILDVTVRVNLDSRNYREIERLLTILANEGLADRISVYPGHIVLTNIGAGAAAASYRVCSLSRPEFAKIERDFFAIAERLGFCRGRFVEPRATPCTAVRAHDLVVGSDGELYKCWDSVGNPTEVVGHLSDYANVNTRIHKWLDYNPFSNEECLNCKALPVCMGGCAFYAMTKGTYDQRCDTFRYRHQEQVMSLAQIADATGTIGLVSAQSVLMGIRGKNGVPKP
jgi:uncharacterized protein